MSIKKIFLISFLVFFLLPVLVRAAGLVPCGGSGEDPCTLCHLFVLRNNIIKFVMFKLVPGLAVLMLIVGGIMFFFAGAKPETLKQARGVITSVVIGLLLVFCAWIIVNTIFVKAGIVKTPSLSNWWKISCEIQLPGGIPVAPDGPLLPTEP